METEVVGTYNSTHFFIWKEAGQNFFHFDEMSKMFWFLHVSRKNQFYEIGL